MVPLNYANTYYLTCSRESGNHTLLLAEHLHLLQITVLLVSITRAQGMSQRACNTRRAFLWCRL